MTPDLPSPGAPGARTKRFSCDLAFYPWTLALGIHFDPNVVRSGDGGLEACWDLHVMLFCWEIQASWARRVVEPYHPGDCIYDVIYRHEYGDSDV